MSNRYACSLCDKTYSRKFDMKRHAHNVHPDMKDHGYETENSNAGEEASEDDFSEPPSKKQRVVESSDESETSDSESEGEDESSKSETPDMKEPEDNPAYQEWLEQAMANTEDLRDNKYQKYISDGMDEEEAKEKAHVKVLWAVKRTFFDLYSNFLQQSVYLGGVDINHEIMSDLTEKVENGMNLRKAVKRVLARHGTQFEGLFQCQDENDDDSEEETDSVDENDNIESNN